MVVSVGYCVRNYRRKNGAAKMSVSFFWKHAGLITLWNERWAFHLLPIDRSCWYWGRVVEQYDMICDYWGLGPLGFIVTIPPTETV